MVRVEETMPLNLVREETTDDPVDSVLGSLAGSLVSLEHRSAAGFQVAQVDAFLLGVVQERTQAVFKPLLIATVSSMPDGITMVADLLGIKIQPEVLAADHRFDVEEARVLFDEGRIVNRGVTHHPRLGSSIEIDFGQWALERKLGAEARKAMLTFAAACIVEQTADRIPSPERAQLEINESNVAQAGERTGQPRSLEDVVDHVVLLVSPQVDCQVLERPWRGDEDGCKAIELPFKSREAGTEVSVIGLPNLCLVPAGLIEDVDSESQNARLEKLWQLKIVQLEVRLAHELKLVVAFDGDMIDCVLLQLW